MNTTTMITVMAIITATIGRAVARATVTVWSLCGAMLAVGRGVTTVPAVVVTMLAVVGTIHSSVGLIMPSAAGYQLILWNHKGSVI